MAEPHRDACGESSRPAAWDVRSRMPRSPRSWQTKTVDESHLAEQIACRRAMALARFDRATQRRRLYAYLARRGYNADDIRRAVKVALGD